MNAHHREGEGGTTSQLTGGFVRMLQLPISAGAGRHQLTSYTTLRIALHALSSCIQYKTRHSRTHREAVMCPLLSDDHEYLHAQAGPGSN